MGIRENICINFFSFLFIQSRFLLGALNPLIFPFFSCPAPFPSRAGPSRTSPIVSCRASVESWKSSRWLLVLASGSYKWWLIEKTPKGWSREQLCWRNGPVQAPAANFQMWGLRQLRLLPSNVALISTSFVSLAVLSGWAQISRFGDGSVGSPCPL